MRAGGRVRSITLMLLGGVSRIERMPPRWTNEALMAAAGPAVSLLLGGLLLLAERVVHQADLHVALFYLAWLNVVLGVFNLLPAFPMDGGRVLRALLAGRLGMTRATRIAATVGRVGAVMLGLLGALNGSFMLMLIAIFLYTGASYEERAHELHELIAPMRVTELMAAPAPSVRLDDTLGDAAERMRRASRLDVIVVDAAGLPVGVLRSGELADRDAVQRAMTRVDAIGDRFAPAVIARPDEKAEVALERARERGVDHVIVVAPTPSGPTVVGLIGPSDVEHAVALRSPSRRSRWRPVHGT
jgi:CBS domain-containing protein